LKVTADDGCSVTGKVTISVFTPLRMPNAFSPNGDGRNDVFRIPPSVSIELVRFSVFDRWGQQVFGSGDASAAWDGRIGGGPAPAGSYVWVVEYTDAFTGGRHVENGVVLLIR
jgi:gliding motility-associated-like protein